jgi:glutamate dehydrogenase (NADP+)
MNNPFENAMTQLDEAAAILTKSSGDKALAQKIEILHHPKRILNVTVPVVMDDGSLKIFQGYRVQFNDALGPYKGGIRFHPNVSLDEVKALSFWMSIKCAVANLPLGGGKGGIIVDPKILSVGELERMSRGYARVIADCVGPTQDVPAPDVNTNGVIMGWMLDEYIKYKVQSANIKSISKFKYTKKEIAALRSTFTGKLIKDGGSEGREEATGLGGLYVLQAMLKKLDGGRKKAEGGKKMTVAVQGFGNVGYNMAKFLHEAGFTVVAVSDSKGGIYVPEGLNPTTTLECKKKTGMLAGCYCSGSVCDVKKGKQITNAELLELPIDVLVPAALENMLTKENAKNIKAKIVLEMANGPTTPEADAILYARGIPVIPDVLSNSGGVTVSCFEWMQNLKGEKWTKVDVNKKLKAKMEKAATEVWDMSLAKKTHLRHAAFVVAIGRILKAM